MPELPDVEGFRSVIAKQPYGMLVSEMPAVRQTRRLPVAAAKLTPSRLPLAASLGTR